MEKELMGFRSANCFPQLSTPPQVFALLALGWKGCRRHWTGFQQRENGSQPDNTLADTCMALRQLALRELSDGVLLDTSAKKDTSAVLKLPMIAGRT